MIQTELKINTKKKAAKAVSEDKGKKKTSDVITDTKKLKKKRLVRRIILGIVASILGVAIGILFAVLWYKNYLLNKITYEDSIVYETFIDENGNYSIPEIAKGKYIVSASLIGYKTSYMDVALNQQVQELQGCKRLRWWS